MFSRLAYGTFDVIQFVHRTTGDKIAFHAQFCVFDNYTNEIKLIIANLSFVKLSTNLKL